MQENELLLKHVVVEAIGMGEEADARLMIRASEIVPAIDWRKQDTPSARLLETTESTRSVLDTLTKTTSSRDAFELEASKKELQISFSDEGSWTSSNSVDVGEPRAACHSKRITPAGDVISA